MKVLTSVTHILEVLAIFLNPERREKAVLRGAINAAENLILIYQALYEKDGGGIYRAWPKAKLEQYKVHYEKQFNAWKDGK